VSDAAADDDEDDDEEGVTSLYIAFHATILAPFMGFGKLSTRANEEVHPPGDKKAVPLTQRSNAT
jgi:hypothetical protein